MMEEEEEEEEEDVSFKIKGKPRRRRRRRKRHRRVGGWWVGWVIGMRRIHLQEEHSDGKKTRQRQKHKQQLTHLEAAECVHLHMAFD